MAVDQAAAAKRQRNKQHTTISASGRSSTVTGPWAPAREAATEQRPAARAPVHARPLSKSHAAVWLSVQRNGAGSETPCSLEESMAVTYRDSPAFQCVTCCTKFKRNLHTDPSRDGG